MGCSGQAAARPPFIPDEITAAAGGGKVQNSHADKYWGRCVAPGGVPGSGVGGRRGSEGVGGGHGDGYTVRR